MLALRYLLLLAAASGGAISLSGEPQAFVPGALIGLALLYRALAEPSIGGPKLGRAFLLGWVAGTVANACALYWVVGLLRAFAHFPLLAALPVASLLWAAQGLTLGVAACLAAGLRQQRIPLWIGLPCALTISASWMPGLFPWRLAATVSSWTQFIQLAEIGGEPLLDLCLALGACGLTQALWRRQLLPALVGSLALLLPLGYGALRIPQVEAARQAAPSLRVGIVQPNVSIHAKHDPTQRRRRLDELHLATWRLENLGAQLTVWPETAYPYPVVRGHGRPLLGRGDGSVVPPELRGPVLAGAITLDDRGERFNSAMWVDGRGEVRGIADKRVLLAFGEYVPLWEWLPFLHHRFPSRGLAAGTGPKRLPDVDAPYGVALLNCYEDILGWATRAAVYAEDGGRQVSMLVNLTNDAWFGDSSEPHLHHQLARLRAVETRRDLLRAVNTGVSAHVSATGEDLARTPTWVQTEILVQARLLSGPTPYLRFGDWLTPSLALLLIAYLARRRFGRS